MSVFLSQNIIQQLKNKCKTNNIDGFSNYMIYLIYKIKHNINIISLCYD